MWCTPEGGAGLSMNPTSGQAAVVRDRHEQFECRHIRPLRHIRRIYPGYGMRDYRGARSTVIVEG